MAKLTMDDALAMEAEERKRKQRAQAPNPSYQWYQHDLQEEDDLLPFSSEAEFLGYQPGDQ